MYLLIVARHQRARYEEMVRAWGARAEKTALLFPPAGRGRPAAPRASGLVRALGVPEPAPKPAPRRRLLVVDDDPRITDILSKHFGVAWEVEVARDGAVALAKTILRRPEV